MENFNKWLDDTEKEITVWTDNLVAEAMSGAKTYSAAKRWLGKQTPELTGNFYASPSECFKQNVVRSMFEAASKEVSRLALGQKIEEGEK